MPVFTVKFNTDNSAFEGENLPFEISRILREIADKVDRVGLSGYCETIRDVNGNDVGRFAIKNDDGSNWSGQNSTNS